MKIGLFGGTFDPIHNAHLNLASKISKEFSLDKIIFIPSGKSYFKNKVTDKWVRYQMVKLAIASYPNFELSNIETKRIGNSYACDTIKAFKKNYPDQNFYWIMGSDSFLELSSWKNYTYILKEISIIVYMRPGDDFAYIHYLSDQYHKTYQASISIVENTKYEVSSSEIRDGLHDNHYISDDLPKVVDDYIKNNHVY